LRPSPGVLSLPQIARRSGYTPVRVWQLTHAGKLPGERANPGGKQWLHFDTPEIREWCASKKRRGRKGVKNRPRPKSTHVGFASWQGLPVQFELLMRQIGEVYLDWTADEKARVRELIRPIVQFDRELGDKGDNLA
jgi:hypothetical protein